jgi:hypothetical protein
MNKIVWTIILIFMFSCGKDTGTNEPQILEGTGTVWLSGGLMYCATQVRMENGDTLIPNQFNTEIKNGKQDSTEIPGIGITRIGLYNWKRL